MKLFKMFPIILSSLVAVVGRPDLDASFTEPVVLNVVTSALIFCFELY